MMVATSMPYSSAAVVSSSGQVGAWQWSADPWTAPRMGLWRVADPTRRKHLLARLADVLLGNTAPDRTAAR